MYFDSLSALLHMEGHGIYVWGVYGVALIIVTGLVLGPVIKRRRFIREEAGRLRREHGA